MRYNAGMADTSSPPRSRRFRFSLRAMLLLVTIIAVSLGWTINKARQQKVAAVALMKLGGQISCTSDEPTTILEKIRAVIGEDPHTNALLVDLSDAKFADSDLAYLRAFPNLLTFWARDSRITDAGLAHLGGLSKLSGLDLAGTQVTDAGLVHLRRLKQIVVLDLSGIHLTDAGLVHLRGLSHLRTLGLANTQVTDAGLSELRGLSQLEALHLHGTQVTDVGVAELKAALPNCNIILMSAEEQFGTFTE